ncbi:MAG TPA: glycosyltransferase family 87 protein, partial [Stellaceae bacterium]|nr:glycosyltransferase family 87 protein [Stellaceae bacterium]
MSGRRISALVACGATLVALTVTGLLFQLEDKLNYFLVVAGLQSAVYGMAVWLCWTSGTARWVVLAVAALAITMRVPALVAPPYLSSDIYRYVWDGQIEAAGFNPYLHTPVDPDLASLRDQDIYPQIASPYAPTIYPPAAEGLFLAVTRISGTVTAMKVAMLLCEVVTFVLLVHLLALEGLPIARVLIYAWHPLPIWEFAGSGHIDAPMITFSVATLWALRRKRDGLSGLFLAVATLTKLYPMVLLPSLYRRWDWRLPVAFGVAIVVGYVPFMSAGLRIFGFLPGYAGQEGFRGSGSGFYVLTLLHYVPGLAALDAKIYVLAAITVLGAGCAAMVFYRERASSPYAAAATLAALFTVLVSPHYP